MIYLDNAATTQVAPEIADLVSECMVEHYGNASSAHHLGLDADKRIRAATRKLQVALGDPDGDHGTLLWTSGGTESDAMGVIGAARANARVGKIAVVSAIEHPAVRESADALARDDFEIRTVKVDRSGAVDPEEFGRACKGASLAALMLVNNEIGVIEPVAEAAKAARQASPDIHFHCDAVQALGKIRLDIRDLGVDSVAVAAHKLHGPKGVGALWLRKGAKLTPLWGGGGQQRGLRPGTFNVPGIVGFGAAAELAGAGLKERETTFSAFGDRLMQAAQASGAEILKNGDGTIRAPHILSLAVRGAPAEPLLHVLESRGVLISAGSACAERDRKPSPVLAAIGLSADFGTLRVSFGRFTTESEIDQACEILTDAIRSFR